MRVAVSVFENVIESYGTTVRAHRDLDLIKDHHSVSVIGCSNGKSLQDSEIRGFPAHIFDMKWIGIGPKSNMHILKLLFLTIIWNTRLAILLLKKRFDVVYCVHDWMGFAALYALSKIRGFKLVFEAHAILSAEGNEIGHPGFMVRIERMWERFVISHVDHVVALSENTYDFYQSYNKKISLIPVFVDTTVFEPKDKRSDEEHDLREIGLVGPFDTAFNESMLDFLYENIGEFDDRIKFVLIGDCPRKIDVERIRYTGYIPSLKDYVSQLCQLDAVIVPTKVATSGPLNKILEVMSCGLPVFSTPAGFVGIYSAVIGEDILVFKENELVAMVNQLVFEQGQMKRIGDNARTVIEQHYSKKKNEERIARVLGSFAIKSVR